MNWTNTRLALLFVAATCAIPLPAQNANTAQIQADVQHQLDKKQFHDVHAQVNGTTVMLTGSVKLLADKLEAVKRVTKTHEVGSVQDQITVSSAGDISDQKLLEKLGKALTYDREGYPSFPFNSIGLQVRNGVVLLQGEVVDPVDKESAVNIVTYTPGVRGLVDQLKVAPPSPLDWGIRRAEYQAVYGASVSTKYAIDPAKPIRIVVDNGHVTLTGVVLSQGDKDIIGLRAKTVPNVFSVTNDLQVAGANSESNR